MAAPTWTTGEVLASADVNEWFVPIAAVKTSDQTASGSTFVNDNELHIDIESGNYYAASMYVEYEGGSAGSSDIQWTFSLPGTTTFHYMVHAVNTSNTALKFQGVIYGTDTDSAATTGTTRMGLMIMGTIWGSSSGTITFRFARNAGSGTSPTVHAGSWLMARRIG